ncbi:MAG: SDR family oxidoreductase, partial [Geminicoccaceae bacterium]|nr:SDR family oxidoreductase [Geminicoccaceae bacterium]
CLPSRDFPMLVDAYLQGRFDLDGFVTETIGIGDVEEAFARMVAGDVLRSVVNDEAAMARILSRTPLGRCGEPAEVAKVALFLASDEASYITGQTIYPDGGRLALNYTVPVAEA